MSHPQGNQTARRLLVMRHAKSDWNDPSLSDFQRPLNRRGQQAVPMMAKWLEQQGEKVDAILASEATRARQTVEGMIENLGWRGAVFWRRELYLAPPATLIAEIIQIPNPIQSLLLVAHNPGLEQLVTHWSGKWQPFPTAAIAIFEFQGDSWEEAIGRMPLCVAIGKPKEL
jgi:phosphohistidine phosphatase